MNHQLIEDYAAGGEKLDEAIRGLTPEDMAKVPPADAGPEVGKWSIQQVVIHLADAEAALADRIRRVIAEDDPVLLAWDENKFAERLMYGEQSVQDAVALVTITRRQLARVLRKLPDSAFSRAGRHSERGRQTLTDLLKAAVGHLDHHLKFIAAKREHAGKLMW
jgi:hypothetical protein